MSRATTSPYEALAQLIAECKQLDASEVGERWNQFNGAIAVAEMVLRDYVGPEPVAYSVTYDGEVTNNIFLNSDAAQNHKDRLDRTYEGVRTVLPLYAAPVAAQPAAAPASLQHQESLVDLFAVIARKHNIATISVNDGDDDKFPILLAEFIHAATCAAPLHESGSAAPIAWISPHLLESLASHRENAKVPSNWSVAVQAAQRNSEDIPLYLNPQGEN